MYVCMYVCIYIYIYIYKYVVYIYIILYMHGCIYIITQSALASERKSVVVSSNPTQTNFL